MLILVISYYNIVDYSNSSRYDSNSSIATNTNTNSNSNSNIVIVIVVRIVGV